MRKPSREEIADIVRNGLVNDLFVKKYREDADLRVELRIDEDDLTDLVIAILLKIGVEPDSVDSAAYIGNVNTPREMVEFIVWCCSQHDRGSDNLSE
jgi:hypothetical protein